MYRIYIFIACIFCIKTTIVQAQHTHGKQFLINGRLRDSSWFRYTAHSYTAGGMPLVAGYVNNIDGTSAFPIGLRLECGYFPFDKWYASIKFSGEHIFLNPSHDANREYLLLNFQYFFFSNTRYSPYIAITPYALRWQYTSDANFHFFDDDTAHKRITHIIPGLFVSAGVSMKIVKHLTFQAGVQVQHQFVSKPGRVPEKAFFGFDLGILYHFSAPYRLHPRKVK